MSATLTRRIVQLEKRHSAAEEPEELSLRVTVLRHGPELSVDRETCLRILWEYGYPTASTGLPASPDGLNAEELEDKGASV